MKTFKQYLEGRGKSISQRITDALHAFVRNRQGLLHDIEVEIDPDEIAEPFGELNFVGADKPALEDAIQRVEKLSTQIDKGAGSNLYGVLSDLAHMADEQDGIRDLCRALSWLPEIDKIRSSRS